MTAGWELVSYVVIVVDREGRLSQIVGTRHSPSRLARQLHRGHQEANEDSDDCNDHQEFNQREAATRPGHGAGLPSLGAGGGRCASSGAWSACRSQSVASQIMTSPFPA